MWGKENLEYLNVLRYDTIYMGDTSGSFELKLQTLDMGYKQFGEVLFLDWDCTTHLTLDKIKQLQVIIYSYPSDYYEWELDKSSKVLSTLRIGTWERTLRYCRGKGIRGFVKSSSMFLYISSLDEYIERWDTPYLNGRRDDQIFIVDGETVRSAKKLNKYIGKKEILFYHD